MALVQYHVEDDIHTFKFLEKNRKAVHLYMNQIMTILDEIAPLEERSKVLRVIIDISKSEMFPLQYALT